MRSADTRASSANKRRASWSALISSVKSATEPFGTWSAPSAARASASSERAAPNAILVASADLPMPGRPAMMSRSDGCRPPIFLSRSRSPVVRPDTPPGRWKRALRTLDRDGQRLLEHDEAAAAAGALVGDFEQALLGCFHLQLAVQFGIGAERVVHDVLADLDELAAEPGIVDGAAILAGVDDADHGSQQLAEIRGAADLIQQAGVLELRAQGDGGRRVGRC